MKLNEMNNSKQPVQCSAAGVWRQMPVLRNCLQKHPIIHTLPIKRKEFRTLFFVHKYFNASISGRQTNLNVSQVELKCYCIT